MERSMKKKNGREEAQKAQERSRFGIGIVPLCSHSIWQKGGFTLGQNDPARPRFGLKYRDILAQSCPIPIKVNQGESK
jgi:hypothetical protein